MRKIYSTRLPTESRFEEDKNKIDICVLSNETLTKKDTMVLRCGAKELKVSKNFITTLVCESQRVFKKPCCPFCRDEEHYHKDLDLAEISWAPYHPNDVTTYEGIAKILNNHDYIFAALEVHNIKIDADRDKAYLAICSTITTKEQFNKHLDTDHTTMIHVLAQGGCRKLIHIYASEDELMDPHLKLKDGRTAADVARYYGKEATVTYLVDTFAIELTSSD